MDIGASSHMSFNSDNFTSLTPSNNSRSIMVGNGAVIPVQYTSNAFFPFSDNRLYLKDILVSDKLIKNLIFVRCFTIDNWVFVDFDLFGFTVNDFNTGAFLQCCNSTSDLYPVLPSSSSSSQDVAALAISSDTWHRRLGHPGTSIFNFLLSRKFISCSNKLSSSCHACQHGKHCHLSFSPSVTKTYRLFELIHSDLFSFAQQILCIYLITRKVIISRHVRFDESHFPYSSFYSKPSSLEYDIFGYQEAPHVPPGFEPLPSSTQNAQTTQHTSYDTGPSSSDVADSSSRQNILREVGSPSHEARTPSHKEMYAPSPVGASGSSNSMKHDSVSPPNISPSAEPIKIHPMKAAMDSKMSAFLSNHTWDLVPRPYHANVVSCRWLYRHKFDSLGNLERYKERLVAQGFSQQPGIDFDETFCSVVKPATIRVVLSIAVSRHWPIHQLDVKNTFLNGDLTKEVYMKQPPSYVNIAFPHHVCRLYDIITTASSTILVQRVVSRLSSEFAITGLGSPLVLTCNPCRTPVDTKSKLSSLGTPVSDPTLYRSLAVHYNISRLLVLIFNWAGCPETRRSTSGLCVFLGDTLVSWSSKRQHVVSRSSAEAEYRGVAIVVAELAWLHNLLLELFCPLSHATDVFCDNISAVYLASNPVQHQRTKHIEIDLHFVRERVSFRHVLVLHVPSTHQFADIFTKGLPSQLFFEFRSSLSIRDPPARIARGVLSM
ncbi:ribonuclease H-like domain-containing protein [Tanacetum coccineum]